MRVTKSQLRRVIREEKRKVLAENRVRRTVRRALRENARGLLFEQAGSGAAEMVDMIQAGHFAQVADQLRQPGSESAIAAIAEETARRRAELQEASREIRAFHMKMLDEFHARPGYADTDARQPRRHRNRNPEKFNEVSAMRDRLSRSERIWNEINSEIEDLNGGVGVLLHEKIFEESQFPGWQPLPEGYWRGTRQRSWGAAADRWRESGWWETTDLPPDHRDRAAWQLFAHPDPANRHVYQFESR